MTDWDLKIRASVLEISMFRIGQNTPTQALLLLQTIKFSCGGYFPPGGGVELPFCQSLWPSLSQSAQLFFQPSAWAWACDSRIPDSGSVDNRRRVPATDL